MAFKSAALNTTTTTWNGAPSNHTTGNARVDLFYAACRGLDESRLDTLMTDSWEESPLDTLKIVAYVRDPRGGKGERKLGRQMLIWLSKNAPENLRCNLSEFISEYGRFDDGVVLLESSEFKEHVIKLWASQLQRDIHEEKPSLAAKWIPSEGKAADKVHQVTKNLVQEMGLGSAKFLRKKFLVPLRKKLDVLEVYMCANQWESINLNHVPSCAMKIHGRPKMAFQRHLHDSFNEYKAGLASGNTKVNANVLYPHEIVEQYNRIGSSFDKLVEAQWKVALEKAAYFDISNALVMSDVSGSMVGKPMTISIALGILISQSCNSNWRNLVMTFETTPRFHNVTGNTLFEQVQNLKKAPWGGSTDFQVALELILQSGISNKLREEDMPKKLIVISDMQFDCAHCSSKTNYVLLQEKYREVGYEIPHLIFWNVNGKTSDFPASNVPNVSLISGFSIEVLKAVLTGNEGDINPYTTMKRAIDDPRYDLIKCV